MDGLEDYHYEDYTGGGDDTHSGNGTETMSSSNEKGKKNMVFKEKIKLQLEYIFPFNKNLVSLL